MKKLLIIVALLFFAGCASTPPLPSNIVFIEPHPDTSPKTIAFMGVWKGKWMGLQDTILIIERIDANTADVILSLGENVAGLTPQNNFYYVGADVIGDTAIGWTDTGGNKLIFQIEDELNKIKGYYIEASTGAEAIVELSRVKADELLDVNIHSYPYVTYSHPFKDGNDFARDYEFCRTNAGKQTVLMRIDIRRYKIIEETMRCIKDDFGWKPRKKEPDSDVEM